MNLILLIISTALIFGIPGVLGNDSALKSCDLVIDDDKRSSHFRFPSAVHLGGFNMEFSLCGQTSCGPGVLLCHKGTPLLSPGSAPLSWKRSHYPHAVETHSSDGVHLELVCGRQTNITKSARRIRIVLPAMCSEPTLGEPCIFIGPTGNVYDFSSLENSSGYSAKDPSGYTYYYNFCAGVVQGSGSLSCGTGTAVCQGDETLTNYYSCGTVSSAIYAEVQGGVDVIYTGGPDARQSKAHLLCDKEASVPVMTTQGVTTQQNVDITVRTRCACPNGCGAPPPPPPPQPSDFPCLYTGPSGSLYNLTSVQSALGITTVSANANYTYNFCAGVKQCDRGRECALCQEQIQSPAGGVYSLGSLNASLVTEENDGLTVVYFDGDQNRRSSVTLFCDATVTAQPTLTFHGEQSPMVYFFSVRTKCACAKNGCVTAGPVCHFTGPSGHSYNFTALLDSDTALSVWSPQGNLFSYGACHGAGGSAKCGGGGISRCSTATTAVCVQHWRTCQSAGDLSSVVYQETEKGVDATYFSDTTGQGTLVHLVCGPDMQPTSLAYLGQVSSHFTELSLNTSLACKT